MNNFFLETHQVVKRFANHTALNGVSIQVPEGQIFGLLGPNPTRGKSSSTAAKSSRRMSIASAICPRSAVCIKR